MRTFCKIKQTLLLLARALSLLKLPLILALLILNFVYFCAPAVVEFLLQLAGQVQTLFRFPFTPLFFSFFTSFLSLFSLSLAPCLARLALIRFFIFR